MFKFFENMGSGILAFPSAVRWTAHCVVHRKFGEEEKLMLVDEWLHVVAPRSAVTDRACERFNSFLDARDDEQATA